MSNQRIIVDKKIQEFVNHNIHIMRKNMYDPEMNKKNFLTIVSVHVDTELKYKTLLNNIHFLKFHSNDIVIVNSKNLFKNSSLGKFCCKNNIQYLEIENDVTVDFGKHVYALKTLDIAKYDFIFFTNDSFIIQKPINHFYNLTCKKNLKLYAYNDSTQIKYHFQSYLFSLRKDAIPKFVFIFENKKKKIHCYQDVINEFELNLTHFFKNCNCFLNIGNEFYHKNKNIFFHNDHFYSILNKTNLLPFVKIRRINQNPEKFEKIVAFLLSTKSI